MSQIAAVFASDFIIKTYNSVNTQKEHLCDKVFLLKYSFYCHEQITLELPRHSSDSADWLHEKIRTGNVNCYSDEDLLLEIQKAFSITLENALNLYCDYLKQSCDIFSRSFYDNYYSDLDKLKKSARLTLQKFKITVKNCDCKIGNKNNLGEIKDTLLSIVLNKCLAINTFQFCSDDKKARKSILAFIENSVFHLRCISYMGFFWIAKKKCLLTKTEEKDFLNGWKNFATSKKVGTNITLKKIVNNQPQYFTESIDSIFDAIWNDSIELGNDGFLLYKKS